MRLAALGLFVFELATFLPDQIAHDADWQHARSPRVGARDASQFVGPGPETLRLDGAIVPEAAGSFGAIETLRRMADEGDAYEFVDGTGRVWGSYVIVRLSQRRRHLLDNGVPRFIDFTIDLDRAGD